MLVEPYIAGKELTCAVMGDKALGVIEIVPAVKFYDYEAKYAPGGSQASAAGAGLARGLRGMPAAVARRAPRARLPRRHPRRFPLRRRARRARAASVCLEVNTQPGMTETSLVPEMARARRHLVRRAGALDGRGRLARPLAQCRAAARRAGRRALVFLRVLRRGFDPGLGPGLDVPIIGM